MKNFLSFFWIFNGENTLFTKSSKKNGLVSEKFFSITGRGGQDPIWNFPIFFLNPSLTDARILIPCFRTPNFRISYSLPDQP